MAKESTKAFPEVENHTEADPDEAETAEDNVRWEDTPIEVVRRASDAATRRASNGHGPQVPVVVVEKTDTRPQHGDDFGKDASVGQKDAHEMRAADATPDITIVSPENDEDHIEAETAAEVADSAAIIDEEPATPPASDDGRTGQRRMSMTPIPEVAATASEVADVAALLDQEIPERKEVNISRSLLPICTNASF
jgi:hypothetical protein